MLKVQFFCVVEEFKKKKLSICCNTIKDKYTKTLLPFQKIYPKIKTDK